MKADRVFVGDIKKCTKYERHDVFSSSTYICDECIGCDSFGHIETDSELYKKDAILIQFKNGGYVDLDNLRSFIDYIKVYGDITKNGFYEGGLIMSTSPRCIDSIFVDSESLKPYKNKQNKDKISARQLRKEFKL